MKQVLVFLLAGIAAVTAFAAMQYPGDVSAAQNSPNGVFKVSVLAAGQWIETGELPFDKYVREKSSVLNFSSLPDCATNGVTIRLVQQGGGTSQIDSFLIGGIRPAAVSDTSFALQKLGRKDFDLADSTHKKLVFTFSPVACGKQSLALAARIEPPVIGKIPFTYPATAKFAPVSEKSQFYTYRINGKKESAAHKLFSTFSEPSSGHPAAETSARVWDDGKNLYATLEFASDNTRDGNADYSELYIKKGKSLTSYKITESLKQWGEPLFIYTDTVNYQHKVYEFTVPLHKAGVQTGDTIELAFAAYGTAAMSFYLDDAQEYRYFLNNMYTGITEAGGYQGDSGVGSALAWLYVDDSQYQTGHDTFEAFDEAQQIVTLYADLMLSDTLSVTRKIMVSKTGHFIRYLDIFENTGSTDLTDVPVTLRSTVSDSAFDVIETSDSNDTLDQGDRWVLFGSDSFYISSVFNGAGATVMADSLSWSTDTIELSTGWTKVSIPAGERVILMHFLVQDATLSGAGDTTEALAAATDPFMFDGISPQDIRKIINWKLSDSDSDGMTDQWEDVHGLDSDVNDAAQDHDGDGLTNLDEFTRGTDPDSADTDSDGIGDKEETETGSDSYITDPLSGDTDNDGYNDYDEISRGTDPTAPGSTPVIVPGDYYVDAAAAFNGDGTSAKPWKDLAYAVSCINNGAEGTWSLTIRQAVYQKKLLKAIPVTQSNLTIKGDANGASILRPLAVYWGTPLFRVDADGVLFKNITFEYPVGNTLFSSGSFIDLTNGSGHAVQGCRFINGSTCILDRTGDITVTGNYFNCEESLVFDSDGCGEIRNNFFLPSGKNEAAVIVSGAGICTVVHNTFRGGLRALDYGKAANNGVFKYNVVADTEEYAVSYTAGTVATAYNCYAAASLVNPAHPVSIGDVTGAIPFITNSSYKFTASSLCKDSIPAAGNDTESTDIDGKTRPIGAGREPGCWELETHTVNAVNAEGGTVTGGTAQVVDFGGTAAAITATPDECHTFVAWSGDYTGTENPLILTNVQKNLSVTPIYEKKKFTVTFSTNGSGTITGTLNQEVVCGADTVSVEAVPAEGYEFAGWSGDYTGTENPLVLKAVKAAKTVVANFTQLIADEDAATPVDAAVDEMIEDSEIEPDDAKPADKDTKDATAKPDTAVSPDTAVTPDEVVLPDAAAEVDTAAPVDTDTKEDKSSGCSLSRIQ